MPPCDQVYLAQMSHRMDINVNDGTITKCNCNDKNFVNKCYDKCKVIDECKLKDSDSEIIYSATLYTITFSHTFGLKLMGQGDPH